MYAIAAAMWQSRYGTTQRYLTVTTGKMPESQPEPRRNRKKTIGSRRHSILNIRERGFASGTLNRNFGASCMAELFG